MHRPAPGWQTEKRQLFGWLPAGMGPLHTVPQDFLYRLQFSSQTLPQESQTIQNSEKILWKQFHFSQLIKNTDIEVEILRNIF